MEADCMPSSQIDPLLFASRMYLRCSGNGDFDCIRHDAARRTYNLLMD